jgi:astacin (peptidase family M12A)
MMQEQECGVCSPRYLPREKWVEAAENAARIYPPNLPAGVEPSKAFGSGGDVLAVSIGKRWGRGVRLTVGFLDNPSAELRAKLLANMNAWGETANVEFVESNTNPQVRIARQSSPSSVAGFWSYVGTDILSIPDDQPTMNLEGFTMQTSESEFHRVVRHEAGHTLGFPHEHMRRELVNLLDRQKTIEYFGQKYGWPPDMVIAQVLTPIEESSILGTTPADEESIMCYQLPATITRTGKPILGGLDIDASDREFVSRVYPRV